MIFDNIRKILFKPDEFFKKIKDEKLSNSFKYVLILLLLTIPFNLISWYLDEPYLSSYVNNFPVRISGIYIMVFEAMPHQIVLIAFLLISSFILILSLSSVSKSIKGKISYSQILKLVIYSNTPFYLFALLVTLSYILLLPFYLLTFSIFIDELAFDFLIASEYFILIILVMLFVYSTYLMIKGARIFFNLSEKQLTSVFLLYEFLTIAPVVFLMLSLAFLSGYCC